MKICHFNNTCEKIQRYCIPCGKDSKRYHKSFTKAGKVVFTIANASVYITFLSKQFYKNECLILPKKRTSQEQRQASCPIEHKNKVSRFAILKIIRTQNIGTETDCTYIVRRLVLHSYFNMA